MGTKKWNREIFIRPANCRVWKYPPTESGGIPAVEKQRVHPAEAGKAEVRCKGTIWGIVALFLAALLALLIWNQCFRFKHNIDSAPTMQK